LLEHSLMHRSTMVCFTASDWQALFELWRSSAFSRQDILRLRARALKPPWAPPSDVQKALADVPILAHPAVVPQQPAWLARLCQCREACHGTALLASVEDNSLDYVFLFATQNPYLAMFLPMRMCNPPVPSMMSLSSSAALELWDTHNVHSFRFKLGASLTHSGLYFPSGAQVWVLEHVSFVSPGTIVANGQPLLLEDFLGACAPAKQAPAQRQRRTTSKEDLAAVISANPWVTEYLKEGRNQNSSGASSSLEEFKADEETQGDGFDAAWEDLQQHIQEMDSAMEPYSGMDFTVVFRRADWTIINLGIWESDRVIAQAAKGAPVLFCGTYKLNKMSSYSYSRYANAGALALAQEYCRRLQFYFNLWSQQSNQRYEFSLHDLASYKEAPGWIEFLAGLPAAGPLRDRAEAVRLAVPQNPGQ
jgi:hypothetical protein